jgi:hypothetical protein
VLWNRPASWLGTDGPLTWREADPRRSRFDERGLHSETAEHLILIGHFGICFTFHFCQRNGWRGSARGVAIAKSRVPRSSALICAHLAARQPLRRDSSNSSCLRSQTSECWPGPGLSFSFLRLSRFECRRISNDSNSVARNARSFQAAFSITRCRCSCGGCNKNSSAARLISCRMSIGSPDAEATETEVGRVLLDCPHENRHGSDSFR